MGQGDRGSLGNHTLLPSFPGGLGTVSTIVQGSVDPRDTSMRYKGFDGEDSDDSWLNYNLVTEAKIQKYAAFCRAFQARKD